MRRMVMPHMTQQCRDRLDALLPGQTQIVEATICDHRLVRVPEIPKRRWVMQKTMRGQVVNNGAPVDFGPYPVGIDRMIMKIDLP